MELPPTIPPDPPGLQSPDGAEDSPIGIWIVIGAVITIALVLAAIVAFSNSDSLKTGSGETPSYPVKSGSVDDDTYTGTYLSFKIPAGVADIAGDAGGYQENVRFTVEDGVGWLSSSIADPTQTLSDVERIYIGKFSRSRIEIAGHTGTLLSSKRGDSVMLIAFAIAKGRLYQLQVSTAPERAAQAERTLRELAASIEPTDEAINPGS